MTRKERETTNRRREIIDAAEKILFAKGFERTTLVEIAKKSEFSRPTLYKYFQNKEEIYLAVHLRGMKMRCKMLKNAMNAVETGTEKLYAFAQAYYQFGLKYPEYIRLMLYWDAFGLDTDKIRPELFDEFKKRMLDIRATMTQVFESIITNPEVRKKINLVWLIGYWFITLRTILNQTIFPVDPFKRSSDPEHYFQFVKFFIDSLVALGGDQQQIEWNALLQSQGVGEGNSIGI
jgi:AcrR family transcriptional regulator